MTKKIFRSMIMVAVVVLLTGLFVATTFIYDYFNKYQVEQLKAELELVREAVNYVGTEYFENYDSAMFRFTVVEEDGTVVYDTTADISRMDNHKDREEIAEALETGYGSSARNSSTLMEKTFYEAVLLESGDVLRISVSQLTIGALIMRMMPALVTLLLTVGVISFVLSSKLTKKIIEPLDEIDLDHPTENNSYEELSPILTKIHKQHKQIRKNAEELHQKSEEFEQITASMSEGLILIDESGKILSINNACKKIYGLTEDVAGKNLLTIDRTSQMSKAVKEALKGTHGEFTIQKNGLEYQFNVNPIETDGKHLGAVILAFDITEKAFAQRNRQEFTANVTHELKTPLQSILGCAELLENGMVKPEDTKRFVGNIYKEASRLVCLINDIIRLSQLDENHEPVCESVNIREVADEVAEVLAISAAEKNVTIKVNGDATVFGVRKYLHEIIYNLCDNAIRYNVNGGKVTVDISRENDRSILAVKDTGIGIDAEHHTRIFERFYRVDKSHSKETGGTGLGLSIVKHAVLYHKGKIEIESERGKGTTVKVIFK
ncbi:MAG: PAS domain S-box protein [Lachnospiraceae bacterium]|nr:PAS domain S-box protein [Lachnospiraceae bacterium]